MHALLHTDPPHNVANHNEALRNEGDGSETRTEEITEPQQLQRNPAYCSIEMMKKTPMTYENVFL